MIIRPGTEEAVGLEVNRMIADPKQIESGQYIPEQTPFFSCRNGSTQLQRNPSFYRPERTGNYPYICTFPDHWTIMKGVMVVK